MKLSGDRCLCRSCGCYFNSTAAFDKHRVGEHRVGRFCRNEADMESLGMRKNKHGYWISRPNPKFAT